MTFLEITNNFFFHRLEIAWYKFSGFAVLMNTASDC